MVDHWFKTISDIEGKLPRSRISVILVGHQVTWFLGKTPRSYNIAVVFWLYHDDMLQF